MCTGLGRPAASPQPASEVPGRPAVPGRLIHSWGGDGQTVDGWRTRNWRRGRGAGSSGAGITRPTLRPCRRDRPS
jgi:hypothetical protein